MSFDSPSSSPNRRRTRGFARRCERCCWTFVTHLPLAFVYGLTTWAVYIEFRVSLFWVARSSLGTIPLLLGPLLYFLLNWSYTTAVFTDPGSPLSSPSNSSNSGYSSLPTQEPSSHSHPSPTSFTVKSTGGMRFCKKCQTRKPDRAHHCSTCRRCVLKMDHHCPWLATCVGLRNYKPFLLFCGYTTVFCWACFGAAGTWFWSEVMAPVRNGTGEDNDLFTVNVIILAVLSGILGLVLAGFTGWHYSLAARGQTTIECLEKTRYLSPLRKSMQKQSLRGAGRHYEGNRQGSEEGVVQTMQRYGQQLAEIHTNALPGVTRVEEGEERSSPTPDDLDLEDGRPGRLMTAREALSSISYADMERERERRRYEDYLDEKDSEKLPSAFDLGWRRNLHDLFGDVWYLRLLPICNSKGDGWVWEASEKWLDARERVKAERESLGGQYENSHTNRSYGNGHANGYAQNGGAQRHYLAREPISQPHDFDDAQEGEVEGAEPYARPGSSLSLRTIRRKSSFGGRSDEDETEYDGSIGQQVSRKPSADGDEDPKRISQGSRGRESEDHWSQWD